PSTAVEEVMTKNVINFSEITTVAECIKTLRNEDIDQAPVLSVTGSLIGMIEDRDLLHLALKSQSED
ncbi:MAG: CBS domain-containing protein, partial [Candidatus Thorarchaeota archaeon]